MKSTVIELVLSTKNVAEEKFIFLKVVDFYIYDCETRRFYLNLMPTNLNSLKIVEQKLWDKIAAIFFEMRLRHFCRLK